MLASTRNVRETLLKAVQSSQFRDRPDLILQEAVDQLNAEKDKLLQRAILAEWQKLFVNGILVWGADALNWSAPVFHLSERGSKVVKEFSRDPSNPDGYMAYLTDSQLDPIADSYIREALQTYDNSCYKATAVLIGGAAERLVLLLRDDVQAILASLMRPNKKLSDWRIKTVFDELSDVLKKTMDRQIASSGDAAVKTMREAFLYHWPSLFHAIRASRNEVGHPNAIAPVTPEDVHAALLIFPHLTRIVQQLKAWIPSAPL